MAFAMGLLHNLGKLYTNRNRKAINKQNWEITFVGFNKCRRA
jgi:hypothetical protein